ncbi:hypothetical protein VY88_25785 [Azospirillum thiophilum]|uniref:DUF2336 domain-containing protein n=1 Tax=Azospirillum thiophilum TaxID=528244 RepID=A0AAC8W4U5_9PROT|nr:DUF2336 domain-containing protein [Azospirillum thiophilum]ALG74975.1 hypothetical protein AL072_28705 [Azospirillum thiophilum]KJR62363.1 hypothetical protein VY88_25785 [Azospirillum thiophilum]
MSDAFKTAYLSKGDVARLLADPSPNSRTDLAAKIAHQFDSPELSEAERKLAEDIIRLMVNDTVLRVRQTLAENLKSSPSLPREIALTLARDVEAVAIPVLSVSTVLTPADLVEILHSGAEAKSTAIARRPTVPAEVADALIESGSERAVAALVANEGAELGEHSLSRVIDRFGASEAVQDPLVHRSRLPITIAERLVAVVSERLRQHLVAHHELPSKVASELILQSRERATVALFTGENDEAALDRLVVQLAGTGRLTPSLLVRSLCTGDIAFFETAMSRMANVPMTNARLLIHDAGRLGLKSLYDKAKLPPALLPACRIAIDVLKETPYDGEPGDRERHRRRVIERILTQYEDLAPEDLEFLLAKLGDMMQPENASA